VASRANPDAKPGASSYATTVGATPTGFSRGRAGHIQIRHFVRRQSRVKVFLEGIVFDSMLARVGFLLVFTGMAFILMGWLGAVGPFVVLIGSGCAAIAFEHELNADGERPVVTASEGNASDATRAA